ncbi:unnamed protein product [Rhodiola kirilowii]
MAASTTPTITTSTATSDDSDKRSTGKSNCHVSRDEIQYTLAKAVELRALHAAVMQGTSPASTSPVSRSRPLSILSAQDYPVFTPTYDEEPLSAYQQTIELRSRPLSGNWDCYGFDAASNADQVALWDNKSDDTYRKIGLQSADDQKSIDGSCASRSIVAIRSPDAKYIGKSCRRSSLGDLNKAKLDKKGHEADLELEVPFPDSNLSYRSKPKNRGMNLSWLFPQFKKKHPNKFKSENSYSNSPHHAAELESASQIGSELGLESVERLKKQLKEAHESRNLALIEVSEMRSSLGELRQKLQYVERYCKELKSALQQPDQPKHQNPILESSADKLMPVGEDVMVKGFLQVVSECRLAVKDFCKVLLIQVEAADDTVVDSLNMLLQPYKLSLTSKYSKSLLYHLEAMINQTLYQNFENCMFQKNGSPKHLDPQQQCQAQFSAYLALRNLSWNDVLSKGTKHYSPEFSIFCDQKMSCIISILNWTRSWPEQLLQAFFLASKCVWLTHLLAFSFDPPLRILRVDESRSFDPHYMDDTVLDRVKARSGASRVKVMVMPGFYVKDRILKCKAICH